MTRIAIFVSFALLVSCSIKNEEKVYPSATNLVPSTYTIQFSDTLITRTRIYELVIDNSLGTADGKVLSLTGVNPPFSILEPTILPATVPALKSLTIKIQFSPTTVASFSDALTITTDDPVAKTIPINISGRGIDIPKEIINIGIPLYTESGIIRLGDTEYLINTAGADGVAGNGDDKIVVLDTSCTPAGISQIPARGLSTPPVAFSSRRALVASAGPDNTYKTSDDEIIFIELGKEPPTKTITIGGLSPTLVSQPVRILPSGMEDTFAVVATAGADLVFGTSDDEIVLVDIGQDPPVLTRAVVGGLTEDLASCPVNTSSKIVVVSTGGTDNTFGTGDDSIVSVDFSSTPPAIKKVVLGNLSKKYSRLVSISAYVHTIVTPGLDGIMQTSDDTIMFLVGDKPELSTQGTVESVLSMPVVLGQTDIAVASGGPTSTSEDDLIKVIKIKVEKEDSTEKIAVLDVLDIPLRNLSTSLYTHPISGPGSNQFMVINSGPDDIYGNSTDFFYIYNTSGSQVSSVQIGGLAGEASRPVAITSTLIALGTTGSDLVPQNQDDSITFVDLNVSPPQTWTRAVGSLSTSALSRPIGIPPSTVLVLSAGVDLTFSTSDDVIVKLGPIPK